MTVLVCSWERPSLQHMICCVLCVGAILGVVSVTLKLANITRCVLSSTSLNETTPLSLCEYQNEQLSLKNSSNALVFLHFVVARVHHCYDVVRCGCLSCDAVCSDVCVAQPC